MTTQPPWSPPSWARLLVYLTGAAMFVIQPLFLGPPLFWFLALDSIVLIGLSPEVFKQFSQLVLGMFGRGSPPTPKEPPLPSKEAES